MPPSTSLFDLTVWRNQAN